VDFYKFVFTSFLCCGIFGWWGAWYNALSSQLSLCDDDFLDCSLTFFLPEHQNIGIYLQIIIFVWGPDPLPSGFSLEPYWGASCPPDHLPPLFHTFQIGHCLSVWPRYQWFVLFLVQVELQVSCTSAGLEKNLGF